MIIYIYIYIYICILKYLSRRTGRLRESGYGVRAPDLTSLSSHSKAMFFRETGSAGSGKGESYVFQKGGVMFSTEVFPCYGFLRKYGFLRAPAFPAI